MKRNIAYKIKNKHRRIKPLPVGYGETTKIAANIGLTPKITDVHTEYKKSNAAVDAGTDILSDVSIEKGYRKLLNKLVDNIKIPIATVPLYGTCINARDINGSFINFNSDDLIDEIEYQSQLGIDVMTVHAAIKKEILEDLKKSRRVIKIPSRGGALIAAYMINKKQENPLYEHFEEILGIIKRYDVTISLGASLRSGSIIDGLDQFYIQEMLNQKELINQALKKGVKVIAEGVGHVSIDMIPLAVRLQKKICCNVPLRPLPICTDRAAGHDDIAGAIAGAVCALNGADILTVITKGEHIGLPRIEDIIEGIKSFKIAGHIADVAKVKDIEGEKKISLARSIKKWNEIFEHAIYPTDAKKLYQILSKSLLTEDTCSMCGSLCALKIVNTYLSK